MADLAFVGRHAGGVDDHATFAVFARRVVLHQVGRGLGHVETAHQVDQYRAAEIGQRHGRLAAQHAPGTEYAGAVDGRIQAAQELAGCGHVRGHAFFIGDIGTEIARIAVTQFSHGCVALVVIDVEQGDLAALGDQMLRHGQAKAGNAAGDDGTGVGKLHERVRGWECRYFTR